MPESPYSYPDPKQATTLYKVLTSAEAEALPSSTSTTAWLGSPLDISDGFLHTSTVHQLPITLRRFFTPENPDVGDTVHIYALPRERIAEGKLRWDHLKSGEVFGHVIGGINPSTDFSFHRTYKRNSEGFFELDTDLPF